MIENIIEKYNKEKLDSDVASTLLIYFGHQIRSHATNILSLTLILFAGIQAIGLIYNTGNGAENIFETILAFSSIASAMIFWQFFRLIYYSYMSSNVTMMDPIQATKGVRYSSDPRFNIRIIRKLHDATTLQVKKDHPLIHEFFGGFSRKTILACVCFGWIFFSIGIILSRGLLPLFNLMPFLEQPSVSEILWMFLLIVPLILVFWLIRRVRSKTRAVEPPKDEKAANKLMEDAKLDIEVEDYVDARNKLNAVKHFAKEKGDRDLLNEVLNLIRDSRTREEMKHIISGELEHTLRDHIRGEEELTQIAKEAFEKWIKSKSSGNKPSKKET